MVRETAGEESILKEETLHPESLRALSGVAVIIIRALDAGGTLVRLHSLERETAT